MRNAGKVHALYRYPIKSMAGEELSRAVVREHGLYGDRIYHFVDPSKSGKPSWVTARKASELVLHKPSTISIPYNVEVETPSGHVWNAESEELTAAVSRMYGKPVEIRSDVFGMQDRRAVSIISMQTIRALGREMSEEQEKNITLDPRRFRANVYINWSRGGTFLEDGLVGRELHIGGVVLDIVERDPRCVMINIDPETAERNELYKMVHRKHDRHAGVYAEVLREGIVMRGDAVYIK